MKLLYSITTLVLTVMVCSLAWEKFSAEKQCADAASELLTRGGLEGTDGTKRVQAACARLAADGAIAESIFSKLP